MIISIHSLDKAAVLAALYNAAKPVGKGFESYDSTPMTVEQASSIIRDTPSLYFEYIGGRVMKVDLSTDELDAWLFDRDNGEGTAARVIQSLKDQGSAMTAEISEIHRDGVTNSAMSVLTPNFDQNDNSVETMVAAGKALFGKK